MKTIKFDLPINGVKVLNLEGLRDNFTTEILELHASGLLLRWIKSRGVKIDSDKLSTIPVDHDAADRLVALCEIFEVEADRAVIEAALSKGDGCQGAALHADPEELKYKEKFEQLSKLMEELKSKKLYLTRDEYNRFVKDKIHIEQEGQVVSVGYRIEEDDKWMLKNLTYVGFIPEKAIGDIVEVGDVLGKLQFSSYGGKSSGGVFPEVKSTRRGVLVAIGEISLENQDYDSICYIRIDHDTAPTIKIISD